MYQSSFAGYFPANEPKYSIIVSIKNKPKVDQYYAWMVAAPVFKEIADHLFKYIKKPISTQQLTNVKDTFAYAFSGNKESVRLLANHFDWKLLETPSGYWTNFILSQTRIKSEEKLIATGTVPDVIGMGLKDAIYLMESSGYRVNIKGKGKVVRQSVTGGAMLAKDKIVELNLN